MKKRAHLNFAMGAILHRYAISQTTCLRWLLETELLLVASLRFVSACFANFVDLDEISQLGSNRWHSTIFNYCVTFLPQFGAPK